MKKFIMGVVVGISVTIGGLWFYRWWYLRFVVPEFTLFDGGKRFVENNLPGARVLDVSVSPDSNKDVNYVYDRLFDVKVSYEREGKIKRITLTYGQSGGVWISPNITDLTILDDKAPVIHSLSSSPGPD